jgi:hypothetical protein
MESASDHRGHPRRSFPGDRKLAQQRRGLALAGRRLDLGPSPRLKLKASD